MASKIFLFFLFVFSHSAWALLAQGIWKNVQVVFSFSDYCTDSFDCDSEVSEENPSSNTGSSNLNQLSHDVSKKSKCPVLLMNQYLDDCDGGLIADSAREKIDDEEDGCGTVESTMTNEELDNLLSQEFGFQSGHNGNPPKISDCLNTPFTTEPFSSSPSRNVKLKTLPENQHQSFITEYYSHAQRLQKRAKSLIHNIHSIDQLIGKPEPILGKPEPILNCTGLLTTKITQECSKLKTCSSSFNLENKAIQRRETAENALVAFKFYHQYEDEKNKILYKCYEKYRSGTEFAAAQARSLDEKCKKIHKDRIEEIENKQAATISLYPWVISDEFKKELKKYTKKEYTQKNRITTEEHKEQVATAEKVMVEYFKNKRKLLSEQVDQTNNTYNCLILNTDGSCEKIKGGLFNTDSKKKSNVNFILDSSPPIENENKELNVYFKNLQCRQEKRTIAESNQEFEKWAALDIGILAGGILFSGVTGGASAAGAIARITPRVSRVINSLQNVGKLKKTQGLLMSADAVATAGLMNEASTTCGEQLNKVNVGEVEKDSKDICQSLEINSQFESDMRNCVFQSSLVGLGILFPVGTLLGVAKKARTVAPNDTPPPGAAGGTKSEKTLDQSQKTKKERKKQKKKERKEENRKRIKRVAAQTVSGGAKTLRRVSEIELDNGLGLAAGKKDVGGIIANNSGKGREVTKLPSPNHNPQGPSGSPPKPPHVGDDVGGGVRKDVSRAFRGNQDPSTLAREIRILLQQRKGISRIQTSKLKGTLLTFNKNGSLYRIDNLGNVHKINDNVLNSNRVTQKTLSRESKEWNSYVTSKSSRNQKASQELNIPQEKSQRQSLINKSKNIVKTSLLPVTRTVQKVTQKALAPVTRTIQRTTQSTVAPVARTLQGKAQSTIAPTTRITERSIASATAIPATQTFSEQIKKEKSENRATSLKDCSSAEKGSYLYSICSLQSRIEFMNDQVAQAKLISRQLSLRLWSGVHQGVISPYFITELEQFLKGKRLATTNYQHLSRYMKNISIIQGRINTSSNFEIQRKMNQLTTYFDQYIRNPNNQNLSGSQELRERISILDNLTNPY